MFLELAAMTALAIGGRDDDRAVRPHGHQRSMDPCRGGRGATGQGRVIRSLIGLVAVLAGAAPALSAQAQTDEDMDPAWAAEVAESWLASCTESGPDTLHLWTPEAVGPGAEIVVVPHEDREPLLHPICLAELAVSPADAASVMADGKTLVVSRNAVPGTVMTVSARVGDDVLSREIRILAPDPRPLDGQWTQVDGVCPGRGRGLDHVPLRELVIQDGRFRATFQPFESYVDFWGDAVWTPQTMTLELVATGQNARWDMRGGPGAAYLTPEGRLVLDGFMFGHLSYLDVLESDCRYTFERLPGR